MYKIKYLDGSFREFANLIGADLRCANLIGADLEGADLRGADLRNANLEGANLYGAYLEGADLRGANLEGANLYGADLEGAKLYRANLRGANLYGADLRGADLRGADLEGADLRYANLEGADLRGANLEGADLRNANLCSADLRGANLCRADLEYVKGIFPVCPEEGSFVCYKKCVNGNRDECLVTLIIHAKSKRVNAIGSRKIRVEKAKVLRVEDMSGNEVDGDVTGKQYRGVFYTKGAIVKPDSFDSSDRVECSNGIHAFMTKREAKEY